MTDSIILADKAYIPEQNVDIDQVRNGYERHAFRQEGCDKCRVFMNDERFNDICAQCDNYLGFFKTWRREIINGKPYVGVPLGDRDQIYQFTGIDLDQVDVKDLRANVPAKHPLTFTGKLYTGEEEINGQKMANQRKLVREFWQVKNGMILAKPRTGKTLISVYLSCAFRRRTIIVIHERELLRQFLRTLRDFTNLRQLEKDTGKKIAGIIQNEKDWGEDWDYVLCTYQQFIGEDRKFRIKKYIHKKFGLLIVDEAHMANARAYSNFVSFIDCKYKLTLTATNKRKDHLDFLVQQILGPVVTEDKTPAMQPVVRIHDTKFKPKDNVVWAGKAGFGRALTWLAENQNRNIMLVKQIFADLRTSPKICILVPCMRVEQIIKLTAMVNAQAEFNNNNRNEDWSTELAQGYHRASDKNRIIKAARAGTETRVIFGIRSKVAMGIDVPAWTHLYMQFPMNNNANFFQLTQRVCTPYEGKPSPVIRFFVDDFKMSLGCFAASFYRDIPEFGYYVGPNNAEIGKALAARAKPKRDDSDEVDSLSSLW